MINKIFLDYDESIIHTSTYKPDQSHVVFEIDGDPYFTIIRPCAKRLIEFCRNLVGKENVYILTTSTNEYANHVNRLGEFGFDVDHILAREVIEASYYPTAYGGSTTIPHATAHPKNVLVDNLPMGYNSCKTKLIGINSPNQYFQCQDYYGVNFPDDPFEEDVMEWLSVLHNQRPIDE